jgi:TonB family protein
VSFLYDRVIGDYYCADACGKQLYCALEFVMKNFYTIICLLLLPCFCLAQKQGSNANDYRFIIDQTPYLEMQFPKRNDIPKDGKVFYALSYDKTSGTAFIYNEYVCGYYNVPDFMETGFEAGANNLQGKNPSEYNKRVEAIMNSISIYWQRKDSLKSVQLKKSPVQAQLAAGESDIYDVVEEMPTFRGGMVALMAYLQKSIKYPPEAEENGIQGRVVCKFVVERDGSIANVRVEKSTDTSLDQEAIRVVTGMPKWNPGKQKGETVRVHYVLPVTFRLQ